MRKELLKEHESPERIEAVVQKNYGKESNKLIALRKANLNLFRAGRTLTEVALLR